MAGQKLTIALYGTIAWDSNNWTQLSHAIFAGHKSSVQIFMSRVIIRVINIVISAPELRSLSDGVFRNDLNEGVLFLV